MYNLIKSYLLEYIKADIINELIDEYDSYKLNNISKNDYIEFIKNNIDYELTHIHYDTIHKSYKSRNLYNINECNCKARIWNNHRSSQCSKKAKYGDYCGIHNNMIQKHGLLRFNRIDEDLPKYDNYTKNRVDWFT